MIHGFPISHSISSSNDSLWGWCNSPTKISSQKLYFGTKKLLILRSLKLLHASRIVAHHINPCSTISNAPLVHSQQIPSCPILMRHAPIVRPLAILNQTIAEIFLGSHGCQTCWKILFLSFYSKPFSCNGLSTFIGFNYFLTTTQYPLFVVWLKKSFKAIFLCFCQVHSSGSHCNSCVTPDWIAHTNHSSHVYCSRLNSTHVLPP